MGKLTELASKLETAFSTAGKESKKIKTDLATVATIFVSEAPAVILQVKRSASRVRARLEEAVKDAEAAAKSKSSKQEKKSEKKAEKKAAKK